MLGNCLVAPDLEPSCALWALLSKRDQKAATGPASCSLIQTTWLLLNLVNEQANKCLLAHELHDRVCLIVFFVSTPAFTHELHGCAAAWLCCDFFSHQHSLMSCIIVMPLQVKGPKKILNRPLLYSLINRIKVGSGRMVGIIEMGAVGGSGGLQ